MNFHPRDDDAVLSADRSGERLRVKRLRSIQPGFNAFLQPEG